jgi:shikimate kinase
VSAAERHLVFVGLMGSGKTTVGKRCAEELGRPFVDTDDLVEASAGQTVAELFATVGEVGFRAVERQAVSDACASPVPVVIACGGGAVLDPDNRRHLQGSGCVVWLQAPAASLADRIGSTSARPLLANGNPEVTLERLATLRAGTYAAVAEAVVDTDGRSVEEVVARALEAYAKGSVARPGSPSERAGG